MTQEEWIKAWTTGRWKGSSIEVITFISNILYYNKQECETIYNLFACGYCYYFANMLKIAFDRGDVVWHKGYGHIVWRDIDNIAYDIGGVFYDYSEGELVPLNELGDGLINFKHIDIKGNQN